MNIRHSFFYLTPLIFFFFTYSFPLLPQDSLNCRFVGNWPFGPSLAVAHDAERNLVFCASGGGVYILNIANPQNPIKVSERLHSLDMVQGVFI